MPPAEFAPRRRRWPIFVPTAVVIVLAAAWTAFWFYAASLAETAIAGWRAREAHAGRIHECGMQAIRGYPFRIELRCAEPSAELRGSLTSLSLKGAELVVVSQVLDPTFLIS